MTPERLGELTARVILVPYGFVLGFLEWWWENWGWRDTVTVVVLAGSLVWWIWNKL